MIFNNFDISNSDITDVECTKYLNHILYNANGIPGEIHAMTSGSTIYEVCEATIQPNSLYLLYTILDGIGTNGLYPHYITYDSFNNIVRNVTVNNRYNTYTFISTKSNEVKIRFMGVQDKTSLKLINKYTDIFNSYNSILKLYDYKYISIKEDTNYVTKIPNCILSPTSGKTTSANNYTCYSVSNINSGTVIKIRAYQNYSNTAISIIYTDNTIYKLRPDQYSSNSTVASMEYYIMWNDRIKLIYVSETTDKYYADIFICDKSTNYNSIKNNVMNLLEPDQIENIEFDFLYGYCLEQSKKTLVSGQSQTEEDRWSISDFIKIIPNEYYNISVQSGYDKLLYGFYTNNSYNSLIPNQYLASPSHSMQSEILQVQAPENANYIVISGGYEDNRQTIQHISSWKQKSTDLFKWKNKKWVIMGDSLTERNSRTAKSYHDYIKDATGITVVNLGISGTGYMRHYDDDPTEEYPNGKHFLGRAIKIPNDADVITVFGSGNDLPKPLGNVTDTVESNTICGYMNGFFDYCQEHFPLIPIGVITPTPWINSDPSNPGNGMELYSNALVEICKRRSIPCLDLYHSSNLHPSDSTFRTLAYSKDDGNGVHPDEQGHKIIAPRFKAFLETLIL